MSRTFPFYLQDNHMAASTAHVYNACSTYMHDVEIRAANQKEFVPTSTTLYYTTRHVLRPRSTT
jgi:hypothetical protein